MQLFLNIRFQSLKSIMPTPLSMYDRNHQAMLTAEPVDTANNIDVSADFLTPFYLTYLTN